MTAPVEGAAEAQKVAVAFQVALAKIGVLSLQAALRLWKTVPANKAQDSKEQWLGDAVDLVMVRRALSRDLAISFYRLSRALRVGVTIPSFDDSLSHSVTLGDLRDDFESVVDQIDTATGGANPRPDNTVRAGDNTVIPIETLPGFDDNGDSAQDTIDKEAEKEAKIVLEALGPNNLEKKVDQIDHSQPATVVDELRDKAHNEAGARQGAAFERIVKNGARDVVTSLAERDSRVIGYVRVSRTGTPCGWCAMLISRGVIFYKSAQSAEYTAEGKQYHDNCNCYAEPVYSLSQYENDPRFNLNREYSDLWPKVTRGLSGKEALSAWRRYFRRQKQQEVTQVQAA